MTLQDKMNAVSRAADGLADVQNTTSMQGVLRNLATAYGADEAYVSLRRTMQMTDTRALRAATFGPGLVEAYNAGRTYDTDPVALHLKETTTVVSFEDLDWSSVAARKAQALKASFGVGPSGLGVSVFGPCGKWGVLVIASRQADPPWASWKPLARCMVGQIGTLVFEKLKAIDAASAPASAPLSPREAEAMTWTARGKTIADTAIILGLANSTVRHLLDRARVKLNAATKAEAVARALMDRQITLD